MGNRKKNNIKLGVSLVIADVSHRKFKVRSRYGFRRWETTLHCNGVSYWLCPYPEWSISHDGSLAPWMTHSTKINHLTFLIAKDFHFQFPHWHMGAHFMMPYICCFQRITTNRHGLSISAISSYKHDINMFLTRQRISQVRVPIALVLIRVNTLKARPNNNATF